MALQLPIGQQSTLDIDTSKPDVAGMQRTSMNAMAPAAAGRAEIDRQEVQLAEEDMASGFGDLMRKGLKGAQAYLEDLQNQGMDDVAQAGAQSLQGIAPVIGGPNVDPNVAQKALLEWYDMMNNQVKSKTDPGWKEKMQEEYRLKEGLEKVKASEKKPGSDSLAWQKQKWEEQQKEKKEKEKSLYENHINRISEFSGKISRYNQVIANTEDYETKEKYQKEMNDLKKELQYEKRQKIKKPKDYEGPSVKSPVTKKEKPKSPVAKKKSKYEIISAE